MNLTNFGLPSTLFMNCASVLHELSISSWSLIHPNSRVAMDTSRDTLVLRDSSQKTFFKLLPSLPCIRTL